MLFVHGVLHISIFYWSLYRLKDPVTHKMQHVVLINSVNI